MPTDRNKPLLELDVYLKHDRPLYFDDFYLKEFIEKLKHHFTEPVEIFNGVATANLKNLENNIFLKSLIDTPFIYH